ncbi:MAG: DinB family protein [Phycisphaeraceae bacterium]|nr:DinB family protein [Phycisphaeraceae bacterium]
MNTPHSPSQAATAPIPPERRSLAAIPDAALIDRFRIGLENFDPRTVRLTDEQLDTAFLPDAGVGRWPCRVLLGHLADAELAFVHRMRRIIGEDGPVFSTWDENTFIDHGLYGTPTTGARHPVGAFLAAIHTLRQWTGPWLATLTPEQFQRTGLHPQNGAQSLRAILEYDTWHLEHHAWYLNRKVARLLGPAA